jgi:hypothetical protein
MPPPGKWPGRTPDRLFFLGFVFDWIELLGLDMTDNPPRPLSGYRSEDHPGMAQHQPQPDPPGQWAPGGPSEPHAASADHPWIAFDILKVDLGNPRYQAVMALLNFADERYDIHLVNGGALSRGLFSAIEDPQLLADLLKATHAWKGKAVYLSGERLSPGAVESLAQILSCYAWDRRCQQGGRRQRLGCLGCHLAGIGLLSFDRASLNTGHRFWFHFYEADRRDTGTYRLNRPRLIQTQNAPRLCPAMPADWEGIVSRLPERLDLQNPDQGRVWMAARDHAGGLAVVPRSEKRYGIWMRHRLEAC